MTEKMCNVVPQHINKILKKIVKEDVNNYEIIVHDPNKKGEGFMGEILFITLEDKYSDKVFNLVVKQAFATQIIRNAVPIRGLFLNEISFYTKGWPKLQKFQELLPKKYQFQKVSKCFAVESDDKSEKIVLENLKLQKFEVYNKKIPLDKEHLEVILKEYGKFHALSFAYKALDQQSYKDLTNDVKDLFSDWVKGGFHKGLKHASEDAMESLRPGVDDAVLKKYKLYHENLIDLFFESIQCSTKYTVITHGDCWSNNMLFKYNENRQVTDVRFIDFQLAKEGSPCCDLSYCIYSGASKEILQDLDYYLQVYHDSLSETLKAFGCDPNELYPLQELKNDWKQYCKLGVAMSLLIWRLKLTYEDKAWDMTDIKEDQSEDQVLKARHIRHDIDAFNEVSRNLIMHLYENDFL